MRSITGLKSKVQILPLNVEFEVQEPEEYGALDKGGKKVISPSVEIDIAKGASFTVVLRMRGGMDRKFFKVFNFGWAFIFILVITSKTAS